MNRRGTLVDLLLLVTVFAVTFAKVRVTVSGIDVGVADVTACLFLVAFAAHRLERGDWRMPRTTIVAAGFFLAFLLVYLVGFFNIETAPARTLYTKGLVLFVVHFAFLGAAVAHLARRSPRFYWQTLAAFCLGIAANGVYALVELGYVEATGGDLDLLVLGPLAGADQTGLNLLGVTGGVEIYRANGLMLDTNHLGIVVIVPLLVLLPLYLRLGRGHALRAPLALLLALLVLVELATLSRSGLLGLFVGLLVLAVPYRRFVASPRMLAPVVAAAAVVAVLVAQRQDFFATIFRTRTSLSGSSTRVHLELYDLLGPALDSHAFFGLGLNTFSDHYAFVTGKTNWGPHSYYLSVISETGLVGAAVFLGFILWVFARLGALRRLGRALAAATDEAAARVRPLGWGLTAALAGTLAANAFYLTMHMYYFVVLVTLAVAAPLVFARRPDRPDI